MFFCLLMILIFLRVLVGFSFLYTEKIKEFHYTLIKYEFHWKLLICQYLQSTFIISKTKGLSEILRDIGTSTYQICRIEEKNNQIIRFHKGIYNLTPDVRDIEKYCGEGEKMILRSNFFLSPQYFITCCKISMLKRKNILFRDKQSFGISDVEITRVNCILFSVYGFVGVLGCGCRCEGSIEWVR